MSHLRELQRRFRDYLVGNGEAIARDIAGSGDALAEHRLAAYYNAYRVRLIDALAVDYPALEHYLGRDAFEELALAYLARHPSRHPSIRWFGRHLAEFVAAGGYGGDDAGFVHELARYEWAQTLVFDAAGDGVLVTVDDMARVPAEAWATLGFRLVAALQWLDLGWNAPAYENAVENGDEPPAPARGDIPVRWLLWRRELKIYWRSLDVHEAWALEQAARGSDFATICEGLLEWVDAGQAPAVAAGFLRQWIGDGLVAELRPGNG